MIAEIILTVCLRGEPTVCREERFAAEAGGCVLSITSVADWQGDHPDWTVERWSCRQSGSARR